MASTDSRPVPIKNTAFRAVFPILDNTGALVTGAAGLDSEVSKDQGTFTDCTNEATEIATSSGIYYLDLTSTEMNADCVAVIVKTSTTDAKTTVLVFYPQESGDIKVDLQSIATTTVSTSTAQLGVNIVSAAGTAWGSGAITAASIASDAITDAKVASDVTIASVTGAVGSVASGGISSASFAAGAITATAIASDAITDAKVASDVTIASVTGAVGSVTGAVGSVTGAVGSVTGAVGSVTGNVGGNVVGSVASVVGAVGSVTGNVGGNVVGSVGSVTTVSDKTGYALSAAGVDAVWDEAMSGHTTAGTYGDKIRAHAGAVLKALLTSGSTTTSLVLNATTGIEGAAPSSTNDFYNGRVIIFLTGALAGQATDITDYVGSTKTLTVTALTGSAASGDTAVIV
jgi:hypothetical protein